MAIKSLRISKQMKAGLIKAKFNSKYTEELVQGAKSYLLSQGVTEIESIEVPGAFELGLGAKHLLMAKNCDFVVCVGVVIRGETAHFDYVCKAAQEGCLNVSLETLKPVGFGVLTLDTYEQLYDRIWGKLGNAGAHAAQAAYEMALTLKG
jgi:6,7-dimethyl-8-ribityllumazine synthase